MKDKRVLFGILLAFVFLISMGLTYAFFFVTTNIEGEPNDILTSTGTLRVLFTDGPAISLLEANPGDSQTKTFTVKNTGSLDSYYKINWQEFNNGVLKDELAVSFTCTSYSTYLGVGNAGNVETGTCDNMTEEAVYNRDLKSNIKIPVDYTHVYSLTVKLLDINVNQNYNQGVTFTGVLQVEGDNPSWVESCENNNSLRCRIITDNIPLGQTEVTRDDVSSTYVAAATGVDFAAKSSLTNGQGLYRNTKIGDGDNYYFRGGNFCAYTNYLTETTSGTACTAAGGSWTNYKCSLDYNETACETAGFTYYRLNNNVSFAGFAWKIVRIDEEGNVRLLYNGTSTTARGETTHVGTASYNSKYKDNAYVGYMQPDNQPATDTSFTTTKEQAESNDINSPVKTVVDNWYRDNIANKGTNITSKIAITSGYCNDRRVSTLDGGIGNNITTYSSRDRVLNTRMQTYKCLHESNDLFTSTSAQYGNKKLIHPVGLMTADELAYGGVTYGKYNYTVYTHSGDNYLTLSPSVFSSGVVFSAYQYDYSLLSAISVNNGNGVRTIISLNSTATVNVSFALGGDGSLEHPYVIEQ